MAYTGGGYDLATSESAWYEGYSNPASRSVPALATLLDNYNHRYELGFTQDSAVKSAEEIDITQIRRGDIVMYGGLSGYPIEMVHSAVVADISGSGLTASDVVLVQASYSQARVERITLYEWLNKVGTRYSVFHGHPSRLE